MQPNSTINCLFCGSTRNKASYYASILFNNKQFVYRECLDCKLNFNWPLLTPEDYEKLYTIDYHDEFYFKEIKYYTKQNSILKLQKDIHTVIDFGCGDGSFLNSLQQNGFSCTGVEFNPELVKKLSHQYPDITFYTVADFSKQSGQYDCAHLGDVLEHMTQPAETIKMLSKRIRPEGYLFVEGPIEHNATLAHYFRKYFFTLAKKLRPLRVTTGAPYHTFLATKKNQIAFFKLMGYTTAFVEIYETVWPFPEKYATAKGFKSKFQYTVGKLSLATTAIFPGLGNRFYYIGKRSEMG
ncbi:MAG: class I SAM-dependent methyltransferase [Bacteroidetes bacterium]|nr:class I SAM-dependent methyltransferase [Bacteroidota bacterium]